MRSKKNNPVPDLARSLLTHPSWATARFSYTKGKFTGESRLPGERLSEARFRVYLSPGMKSLSSALSVLAGIGLLALAGCAHKSPRTASTAAPAQPAPAASPVRKASPPPANSIPGIAQREVIRRRERLRQIDDAALRAHQAMAEGDLENAVSQYRSALNGLPASR